MLATLLCFDSGFASSIITGGLTPMRQQFGVSTDVSFFRRCQLERWRSPSALVAYLFLRGAGHQSQRLLVCRRFWSGPAVLCASERE